MAKHDPPIESVLMRTLFMGGPEQEQRIWRMMEQISENGALPAAGYGLLMIGYETMVYHHSTTQNEKGQRSVVCSVPGSPFAFVCDEAAIRAKPFGQQQQDYYLMKMRQQGFEPCAVCSNKGQVMNQSTMAVEVCVVCEGRGFVPLKTPPLAVEPEPLVVDKEFLEKVSRLMAETGFTSSECEIGLRTWAGDYEKALKWLDDSRLGL